MRKIVLFILFLLMTGFINPVLAQGLCVDASCGKCAKTAVWTAFGCVDTAPSAFIGSVLKVGIGMGGGVAFLLILFGGFQILTSAGNPEQLTAGRELVSSAITGLLLIIFSIFLLRLIGFNILGIPGFG